MKPWWEMTDADINACLQATDWCPAELCQFRGGGFSSHFKTDARMPLTMVRVNLVAGVGPSIQIAEGYSITLPEDVHKKLDERTDPTWPTTWFVPNLTGEGAFKDVYSVMADWGAISMHNVDTSEIFRPHVWSSFGTAELESADLAACQYYGSLY